jgi:hypothetical protein
MWWIIGVLVVVVVALAWVLTRRGAAFGERGQDALRDAGRPAESFRHPGQQGYGATGGPGS